jgi:hypothetical protein
MIRRSPEGDAPSGMASPMSAVTIMANSRPGADAAVSAAWARWVPATPAIASPLDV